MAYSLVAHTNASLGVNGGTTSGINTTGADLIVISVGWFAGLPDATYITDNKSNTWHISSIQADGENGKTFFYYAYNATVGSGHTFTITSSGTYNSVSILAFSGSYTASDPLLQQSGAVAAGSGSATTVQPGSLTPAEDNDLLIVAVGGLSSTQSSAPTINSSFVSPATEFAAWQNNVNVGCAIFYQIQTTATARNPTATLDTGSFFAAQMGVFKAAATAGIAFDVAANSGDQAAANTYSGSASWNGTNRMLAIDVSLLGAGTTVTSMTYGGANCTFIGSRSTVTSLGSIEQWRITSSDAGAPGTGANTLVVNLSGTIEFSAEWVSYTGVHQTSPTEGFNSAQATNTGSATDASVVITTASDNCWIHAAVVANDTSITANQTSRNNISGTLGSGANEDNNTAVTPPGTTTMSYTGMGITTTWAIAGYAIRPVTDAALVTAINKFLMLMGLGT